MDRYSKCANEAGKRGLGKHEVKAELDRIMKEMMKEATEWKIICELKGTKLPPLTDSSYPLQM